MKKVVTCWVGFVLIGVQVGCDMPGTRRLNAPPQGFGSHAYETLQAPYEAMADNAMLADMSMNDSHFVPHTTELNGLGARRLERYAVLLKPYGGTLRFDSRLEDEQRIEECMEHIREFLVAAGLKLDEVQVERGIPGGRGLHAEEAIQAVENARAPSAAGENALGSLTDSLGN